MNKAFSLYKRILIQEGGNAVANVTGIVKANVEPTLQKLFSLLDELDPSNEHSAIGSTGLKAKNGDLDIAVDTELGLAGITAKLKETSYEVNMNKGLNQVSIGFPQIGPDGQETGELVQVDLMMGKIDWMKFKYTGFSESDTEYKSLGRIACLGAILKYMTGNEAEESYGTNNFGVFQKKNGTKIEGSLISEPDQIVSLVNKFSIEPWTRKDLESPIEYMWPKITRSFPDQAVEMGSYIQYFLDKQGFSWKNPLGESRVMRYVKSKLQEAKTGHLTHVEDLIYDEGSAGGKKAIKYVKSMLDELKGHTPEEKVNPTIKWDGNNAIIIGNSYPGIDGPFVGMKNIFSPKDPQYFQNDEEIFAHYEDPKFDMLRKYLSASLEYAPRIGIPDGQLWKGDFLFLKGTPKQPKQEVIDGKNMVTITPNTLTYAAEQSSKIGQKLLSSTIGIAFHTRYSGNDLRTAEGTAQFDADFPEMNDLPDAFFVNSSMQSIAGNVTLTEEETAQCESLLNDTIQALNECSAFADEIASKSTMRGLLNKFENYGIRNNFQFEDIGLYLDKFIEWIPDNYPAASKIQAVQKYFTEDNRESFLTMLLFQKGIVELKEILVNKLNTLGKMGTFFQEPDGSYSVTGQEGFAVSDVEGSIIKLVSRLNFSKQNRLKHDAYDSALAEDVKQFLSNFIKEKEEQKVDKKYKKQITSDFGAMLKSNGLNYIGKSSDEFRIEMKDADTQKVQDEIKNLIQQEPFLKEEFVDFGEVLKNKMAGGKSNSFDTIQVLFQNGVVCYVLNRLKAGKTASGGTLTPVALGLTGTEFDSDSLIESALASIQEKVNDSDLIYFLSSLVKSIEQYYGNDGESYSFNLSKEDPLSLVGTVEVIPVDLEDHFWIDDQSIFNDFGEILSAVYLGKRTNESIQFPSAANEPLVDFYIGHTGVSAKNKSGAAPSLAKVVSDIFKDESNPLVIRLRTELPDLEKLLLTLLNKGTEFGWLAIAEYLGPELWSSLSVFGVTSSLDEMTIPMLQKAMKSPDAKDNLQQFYGKIGASSRNLDMLDPNNPKAFGYVISPLSAAITKKLNAHEEGSNAEKMYSLMKQAVNSYLVKQIYIVGKPEKTKRGGNLTFEVKTFESSDISFETKLTSNEPNKGKISFKLKK